VLPPIGTDRIALFEKPFIIEGSTEKSKQILQVSRFTMLDTPVPIRSLKLSNIGSGYYLDGRPLQVISGSAGTSPPLQIEYSLFRLSLSQSSD
jgi:hypothetical protein